MPCWSLADKKPASATTLAARLARLGLRTDADYVLHLPLRYEDETRITAVRDAQPGVAAQFDVEVIDNEIAYRPRRQLVVRVSDASGTLTMRFLNFYPNQQKAMQVGARLRFFGELHEGYLGPEIIHPRFHVVGAGESLPECLTPVYPTTAGLGQATLRRLIARALDRADLTDTLPAALLERLGLPDFTAAIQRLHNPPPEMTQASLEARDYPAWRRVQFDELLAQQLSLRRAYTARRARGAPSLQATATLTTALLAALPFRLTGAQQRAWQEIASDLDQPHPMQRLLQGDVGSGKTVVAALAMLHAVEAGYQAALMAPTEILAEQHYRKLAAWLAPLGLEVAWLTGSLKKRGKEAVLAGIASGNTPIVIGTHALIEDKVEFARLGLAIVDEQHRFGVRQRLALKEKGLFAHQLAMSATPIPRTLAMSYYADLDVSVLDELPPGRTPVTTKLIAEGRRDQVVARVREACRAGGQAYWVCPLIEESEALDLTNATETHALLTEALNPPGAKPVMIGLLHSRMPPVEKKAVMALFESGTMGVLVSTTVIEVGVDVPNASLMVIEHAERFGLSQLHQLRGRVGRGAAASACVLMYATGESGRVSETARERLRAMVETSDGFEIARRDLEIRGPGEFLGARQSGAAMLRFADLAVDIELLEWARALAPRMLDQYPELAERHVQRWLGGKSDFLKA